MLFKRNTTMTYVQINELMSRISIPLSLYLLPVNEKEERAKSMEDISYNPHFTYRKEHKNRGLFSQIENVTEITDVDPEISSYIIETIQDKKQAALLFDSIGNDAQFIKISRDRFGIPSTKLFRKACKLLRGHYDDIVCAVPNERRLSKLYNYDTLLPVFEKVFELLGLEGWSFEKSKAIKSKGFRTVMKTKRIIVDPEVEISAEKLRKTIVHEVVTHAIRGNNGYATGYSVFGKPNIREYLDDEEGLALYNEEQFGLLRKADVKQSAALVYAIYLGQTMSFREVFNALSAVYPRKNAYNVTLRVKRGISDTTIPGTYNRDACYLRGFFKMRRILAGDSTGYRYLYAGKIPFSKISLVEEGILPKPSLYPTRELIEKLFKECGLE